MFLVLKKLESGNLKTPKMMLKSERRHGERPPKAIAKLGGGGGVVWGMKRRL